MADRDDELMLVDIGDLKLPFTMDEGETNEATRALLELSEDAAYYGSKKWVDVESTPRQVKRLILKAAARHMKNYEGYITSRAGDETVSWSDRGTTSLGDAQFTTDEKKRLRELGGNYRATVQTVGLYHSTKRLGVQRGIDPRCTVPTDTPGEKPMPYFADPVEPW